MRGRMFGVFVLIVLLGALYVWADSIDVESGRSYYVQLEGLSDTTSWAGLRITHDGTPLSESIDPFATITLNTPVISTVNFPGQNFKDDQHYYAAMHADQFNLSNLVNASVGDLAQNQMFDSTFFPIFYPQYDNRNDNPENTFCCDTQDIMIGGRNFSAFRIEIQQGIEYFLLRYDDGATQRPIFVVRIEDALCYNATSCVGQFMLPVTNTPYNFFALSRFTPYDYTIWIDGIETNTFLQTGLPYNVTMEVRELYTGVVAPFKDVLIIEELGQNIFIPYRLSGQITESYAIGVTDGVGRETFLVSPTVYPTITEYQMYVAVLNDGIVASPEELFITSRDILVSQSKPFAPPALYDNAKASVNSMNQINNFLFRWSSELLQALRFTVEYNVVTDTFTTSTMHDASNLLRFKTGAPNVVNVVVTNGVVIQPGYSVRVREEGGFLVMNPYTESAPLTQTTRIHKQTVPAGTEFIVTPTSLGAVQSNISIEILDASGDVVAISYPQIEASLNIDAPGAFYNNDLLKTIVNAMNSVIYSLYYSLNF